MNQSWSIVIFGYNEEETIASVTSKANKFLDDNNITESEIIIVDDGSIDNSRNIINDLKGKLKKIKYVRHDRNFGIGSALLSGYNNAKNENVVAIPADGQFDINELRPYINFPEKSFISFFRIQYNSYTPYRKIVTRINHFFNKALLNLEIKDINWVKAYKTNDLKNLDLKLGSSLIASEICAKLSVKGYNEINSSSVYHSRIAGKAKGASIKTLSQAVKELVKIVIVMRKFKQTQR